MRVTLLLFVFLFMLTMLTFCETKQRDSIVDTSITIKSPNIIINTEQITIDRKFDQNDYAKKKDVDNLLKEKFVELDNYYGKRIDTIGIIITIILAFVSLIVAIIVVLFPIINYVINKSQLKELKREIAKTKIDLASYINISNSTYRATIFSMAILQYRDARLRELPQESINALNLVLQRFFEINDAQNMTTMAPLIIYGLEEIRVYITHNYPLITNPSLTILRDYLINFIIFANNVEERTLINTFITQLNEHLV